MAHLCSGTFAKFWQDRQASVTVEFVIALPLLLAMLAFAVQYGNALKVRNNLDIASRDAARYLARAPLDNSGSSVDQAFIDTARDIISARLVGSKATVSAFSAGSDETAATVEVTIDVPFPLLTMIGLFGDVRETVAMQASENWLRTGDAITTSGSSGV